MMIAAYKMEIDVRDWNKLGTWPLNSSRGSYGIVTFCIETRRCEETNVGDNQ